MTTQTEQQTIVLSIETDAGTYQHGFHLGTDLALACTIAERAFRHWKPRIGTTIKTVALKGLPHLLVFDGEWSRA